MAVASILVRGWAGSSRNQYSDAGWLRKDQRPTNARTLSTDEKISAPAPYNHHADSKDHPSLPEHRWRMRNGQDRESGRLDDVRRNEQLSATDAASTVRPARGPTSARQVKLKPRGCVSRRGYDTRRPVVAANPFVRFTVHHNPAQLTFLRPAGFPEHRLGHDRRNRARTRLGCIYCASPWSDLCAVYRSSRKGARERAQK